MFNHVFVRTLLFLFVSALSTASAFAINGEDKAANTEPAASLAEPANANAASEPAAAAQAAPSAPDNAESETGTAGTLPAATPVPYTHETTVPDPQRHYYKLEPLSLMPSVPPAVKNEAAGKAVQAVQNDVDFGPFMAVLQRRIKRAWFPPRGQESRRVQVIFKIHQDGKVSDLRIEKSSGCAVADHASLDAVTNASPFEALPKGAPAIVDIQFTFDYNVFSGGRSFGAADADVTLKRTIAGLESSGQIAEVPATLVQLAHYYVDAGRKDEALDAYKKARLLLLNKVKNKPLQAYVDSGAGVVCEDLDKYSEAAVYFREALEIRQSQSHKDPATIAFNRCDLATALLWADDGHLKEALSLFDSALAAAKESGEEDVSCSALVSQIVPSIEPTLQDYRDAKDWSKALPLCAWLLNHISDMDNMNDWETLEKYQDLADCHYELKQYEAALPLYDHIVSSANEMHIGSNQIEEAGTRLDEICKKLGFPTRNDLAMQANVKSKVNHAFSWVPFTLEGTLFALAVLYLARSGRRFTTIALASMLLVACLMLLRRPAAADSNPSPVVNSSPSAVQAQSYTPYANATN